METKWTFRLHRVDQTDADDLGWNGSYDAHCSLTSETDDAFLGAAQYAIGERWVTFGGPEQVELTMTAPSGAERRICVRSEVHFTPCMVY